MITDWKHISLFFHQLKFHPHYLFLIVWIFQGFFFFIVKLCCSECFSFPLQVCVRAGIYHGGEALCDIANTRPQNSSSPKWNEFLDFNLSVCDIPLMARLCLVIYVVDEKRRRTNRVLFPFCGKFIENQMQLHLK